MNTRRSFFLRFLSFIVLLVGVVQPQSPAYALTTLTVQPLTWNVIGLDSNDVNVGPNHFPVGARVCNTGGEAATNVTAVFQWDTADPYIALRPGTLGTINLGTLNAGGCADAYFEVEVTRNSSAYDHTRRYHIEVTAGNVTGTISTPTPREVFVEHLISQSRNAVTDVQLNGVSIAPGGTMTLMVGQTYTIKLVGYTATQGYEQIEYFINFPNTIFQILSVSSSFTADTSPAVGPSPIDKLYGDNCVWENDPNSPNYRACLAVGKTGGNIEVTYQVRILQVPGAPLVNPEPLSTLIYDFSGSSFHYNADYGLSTRFAYVVNASLTKSFLPKTINPGQASTLTFTVNNPGPAAITGVDFTDDLPAGVMLANSSVTYTGCGSPLPATVGDPLTFSNITVAGLGTCTIAVAVTAATDGTYNNTSGHLFINSTIDTGSLATDSLVVSSNPVPPSSCGSPVTLASWSFPPAGQGSGGGATTPDYTTRAIDVSSATGLYTFGASGTPAISTVEGSPAVNSWSGTGGWAASNAGFPSATTGPYYTFTVDTSNYGGVRVSFNYALLANGDWANPGNNYVYVYASADGAAYTTLSTITASKGSWFGSGTINAATTGATTTAFRINAVGANKATSAVHIDEVIVSGCALPVVPTLSKNFSPTAIARGTNSTLTFALTNTNTTGVLTGVGFSDTLPTGLLIATPNGLTQSCSVGTLTGGTMTAAAGTSTISLSGATLSANANCTVSVNVLGNVAGLYTNISTSITSTETGPNTTLAGYGTSSLTVVAPPVINKAFTANPIFTGDSTALAFSITNPNTVTTLAGVNFTDNLPSGLVVATPNGLSNTCGGVATAAAASSIVSLTGVSLAAGDSCTLTVNVTGTTAGLKTNSVTVGSTNGGTGNTSTADVLVKDAAPSIRMLKQVGPTASGPWTSFVTVNIGGNVFYRFSVENTGDVLLTNVSVNDPTVSTAGCSWVDGDGTALTAPFSLPVANANDDQIAMCVLGPIAAVSGLHTNTATASGTSGSTVTTSSSATYGTPALTLVKTVTQTSFTSAGETLNYSYLVTNSGFAPLLGPVTVTDDKATVTCPAVSTVGDGDDWLDPADYPTAGTPAESLTCTATYTVVAGDVAAGSVTNTALATAGGITSNTDSETVYRIPDFTVTKTNNVSGSVAQNGTFNWTITVSQSSTGQGLFADTQTILSDTLPGAAGYYPQGALTVTPGGTAPTGAINCSITGTTLSCVASGAVSFPANASFSVTFAVTPTAAGSLSNTATVDPSGNITELDEINNSSTDVLTVPASPSISKSFSPNPTVANANSTLSFTLSNANTGTALTGVAFSDTYPTGLVNATPLSTTNTCGGTLTAAAGGGNLALSAGTIAANSNCTITVEVVAATGGSYANTTGSIISTNGGTGNTASSTLNVFEAQPFKSLVNTSEAFTGISATTQRVAIGEMIRYHLAALIPEGSFTNVQLLDGLPTGLQFLNDNTATVAFVCNGSANCITSSTLSGAGLVVSGSSNSVSPTFTIPGAAISGGPFGSGTDVTFGVGNITNSDADVDAEYVVIEFNALVLNVNSGVTINQGVDNQTGVSNTNNRQNDVTLQINGATVGATSGNVTVAIAEPAITGITKSVAPATGPYLLGDALTYTLTFSNIATGNNATTAFDIVLTDTFDLNLTLGTVNVSSTQGATCAGGTAFSTGISTAGQLVTVNVSCLDPGSSVTVTVNATISVGTTSGTTISNSANLTYTSLPSTQGNCAVAPFSCSGVGAGGSGTGERNGSGGAGADGAVLNNYAVTSNTISSTVLYGNIAITKDAVPNDPQDFSFTGTGPSLAVNFSVDDDTDPTLVNTYTFSLLPGSYSFTEGAVAGWNVTGLTCVDPDSGSATDIGTATATIDLDAGETINCTFTNAPIVPPSISKNFTPDPIFMNGVTTLTFTITNPNAVLVLTDVAFNDPLPAGLEVASTPNASTSAGCGSPAFAPAAGNTTLTFSAGTIPASGTCTVTVDVMATTTGAKNNTTGNVSSTNGGTGNTANDTLTVNPSADLSITKTDGVANVNAGGTTTYTIRVTNNGPSNVSLATISDPAAAGLSKTGMTCSATPGQCVAAPTVAELESGMFVLPDLASGDFYEVTVTANVTATSGSVTNTAMTTPPGGASDPTPGNNTVSDTDTVDPIADLVVAKTDGVANVQSGSATTYTLTLTNNGPSVADNSTISDPVVVGLTKTALGVCSSAGGAVCPLAGAGAGQLNITNLEAGAVIIPTLPSGGSISFDVTVDVTATNGTVANTFIATPPIGTTDPTPASSTDTDNVIEINALNDTGATINGTPGGQSLVNVLTNDTLNGTPVTFANVLLTQVSTTDPGVTLNPATGSVNVAAGTPAGNYTVTYQICDQLNPTFCDTATVTVPVVVIDAVNDDFSGTPVNGLTGGTTATVYTNDTLNGLPFMPAAVIPSITNDGGIGVTINASGTLNVPAGSLAGMYTVAYQICDMANPTICDTANVTIVVDPPVINAVNDDFSGTPVNGYVGGNAGNAFGNDTLNGLPIVPAQITAAIVTPATNPGVTLNTASGSVDVAAGTLAGTYTIDYQICENLNPSNCDTATITVVVNPPVIDALNDFASGVNGVTGAAAVLNVFDNDTLNGVAVVLGQVTLTETVPDPSGALTLNPNGTIDVAPGTLPGTYQLTYQICEIVNPANCDTAVATAIVGTPPAPVAQDDSTTTPFNTPATLPDITANDTAFGAGNSIVRATIDLDPAPGLQTSFTDTSGNQWSANTATGDVLFTPATNYTGTTVIPYWVQDAAGQVATANLSVTVAPPASISGVVFNDLDLNRTRGAGEPGINAVNVYLYDSTGSTLIASTSTASGGAYNFPNLTAGNYLLVETDPAGYVSSTSNSFPVTVPAGGSATVNFGDYQLPNTTPSTITGTVFNDANGNAIMDVAESPLSAVTIQLANSVGTVIATTTTNASGGYTFANLPAGTYTVIETDPAGYVSTTLNQVGVVLTSGTTATVNFGDQTSGAATIADPAVTKSGSPDTAIVGSIVVYTITVGNTGNTAATNVVLTDTKPAFLDIISITITPNPGLTPVISGNTFTINFGTVAPTDSYDITVVTRVNSLGQPPGGTNNVAITTSSATDRTPNNTALAGLQIIVGGAGGGGSGGSTPALLPATGFAPNVETELPAQPHDLLFAATDVVLEIPSLGIKLPIVGVPKKNGAWDVSWLGKQAGWLEGSAFPSWSGNSVLTSHVYGSNGLPGPFVNLSQLKFGDQIIVHAYGQKYIFEVQTNQVVAPTDTSAFKHEEKAWLTLITCKEYDEKTNTYGKHIVVRAVLVKVVWDK